MFAIVLVLYVREYTSQNKHQLDFKYVRKGRKCCSVYVHV